VKNDFLANLHSPTSDFAPTTQVHSVVLTGIASK
jgi:hypothetical protein